jgi:hypothetical protein
MALSAIQQKPIQLPPLFTSMTQQNCAVPHFKAQRMAIKSLADRRTAKLEELERIKRDLSRLETQAAERIGRLAARAGIADLDISDEQLVKEFAAITARFQKKSQISKGGKSAATNAPPPAETGTRTSEAKNEH